MSSVFLVSGPELHVSYFKYQRAHSVPDSWASLHFCLSVFSKCAMMAFTDCLNLFFYRAGLSLPATWAESTKNSHILPCYHPLGLGATFMIKHWYIIMTQSPQLTLQVTVCVVHSMSFVKCRTKNPVCSACSSPQARNDWTQWGRRVRSWDGLNARPLAPLVKVWRQRKRSWTQLKVLLRKLQQVIRKS